MLPIFRDRQERKVFTHLIGKRAGELNNVLTHGGFRRSQTIAYRPACDGCRACVSVRVLVDDFAPSRNMRRVQEANDDLVGEMRTNAPDIGAILAIPPLSRRRHSEGGMADMTALDFAMMVEDRHVETRLIEYRQRGPDSFINGRGEGSLIAAR